MRLHLAMDRVEDALFFHPARALSLCDELDRLLTREPDRVAIDHRLRAEGLGATALGLTGKVHLAAERLGDVVARATSETRMPQDVLGWLYAKYATVLIKLARHDEAEQLVATGLSRLTKKSEPVRAVMAQLILARGRIQHDRGEWEAARDSCLEAYRLAEHRIRAEGGYYSRGDITRGTALFNLVRIIEELENSPEKALAFLAEHRIEPFHNFRRDWGYAPYHEVLTVRLTGTLLAKTGRRREAITETAWAARGFVKLGMPFDALETALDLAELDTDHREVIRTMTEIANTLEISPELHALIVQGEPHRSHRERLRLRSLIALERQRLRVA
ncbi:MAG: hypothetical protein AAGD38_21015 [Acidobacteriota bacterium]